MYKNHNAYSLAKGHGGLAPANKIRGENQAACSIPQEVRPDSKQVRLLRGAGSFGEAGHGFGFGVVYVKHREQFRDLQDFLELAAEMAQL